MRDDEGEAAQAPKPAVERAQGRFVGVHPFGQLFDRLAAFHLKELGEPAATQPAREVVDGEHLEIVDISVSAMLSISSGSSSS